MKQVFFILLLVSLNQYIYSQQNILTEKENIEWISEFKKLISISDKIQEIRRKIYIDSNYIRKDALNKVGDKLLLLSNSKTAKWSIK
ncbi:MAG: hypothetical protein R2785_00480 [Flavobacteriaceae bacterium]